MIERKAFFEAVRRSPFPGSLGPGQVDGINLVLDEWERRSLTDLRQLAYMLATCFWETARTMQAIREFGQGRGKKYGVPVNGHIYYGRGLVQLTWDYNYEKMGKLLGVDLLNEPDLALDPAIAVKIMFEGMARGTFTGKKLSQYFGPGVSDWTGARKIINGTDKDEEIAKIARQFYAVLFASRTAELPRPDIEPIAPKPQPANKTGATISTTAGAGAGAAAQQAGFPIWAVIGIAVGVAVLAFIIWKSKK